MSSIALGDGSRLDIRFATARDTGILLALLKELADYEKMSDDVLATEDLMKKNLFGERKFAEVLLADRNGQTVSYAIFFHNYSSFLAKPGLYLEDLYVKPEMRGLGIGKCMLAEVAKIARDRDCARFEWSVLDWNKPAIDFYDSLGAKPLRAWIVYRMVGDALARLAKYVPSRRIK